MLGSEKGTYKGSLEVKGNLAFERNKDEIKEQKHGVLGKEE